MNGFLLKLIGCASTVACIAFTILWVRSYWIDDIAEMESATATIALSSNMGQFKIRHDSIDNVYIGDTFQRPHGWMTSHFPATTVTRSPLGPGARWDYRFLGFSLRSRNKLALRDDQFTGAFWWAYWEVSIPHLALVLLLLIPPALAVRRIRQDRRSALGLCAACGYDLRATPNRCPECGAVMPQSM
jgi:hypothetical protein